jgi:prolipoprotein diacylglyceryltransferase
MKKDYILAIKGAFSAIELFGIIMYWVVFFRRFTAYVLDASTTSEAFKYAVLLYPLFLIGVLATTIGVLVLYNVFSK